MFSLLVWRQISKLMDTILNCSSKLYFSISYWYISFSVSYKEVGPLESCAPDEVINTPQECRRAATILGLPPSGYGTRFSGTWPGAQSGCSKVTGLYQHRNLINQVSYNYANDRPSSTDPNYSAICRGKDSTSTTTGSDESSFTSCNSHSYVMNGWMDEWMNGGIDDLMN